MHVFFCFFFGFVICAYCSEFSWEDGRHIQLLLRMKGHIVRWNIISMPCSVLTASCTMDPHTACSLFHFFFITWKQTSLNSKQIMDPRNLWALCVQPVRYGSRELNKCLTQDIYCTTGGSLGFSCLQGKPANALPNIPEPSSPQATYHIIMSCWLSYLAWGFTCGCLAWRLFVAQLRDTGG